MEDRVRCAQGKQLRSAFAITLFLGGPIERNDELGLWAYLDRRGDAPDAIA